MILNLTTLFFTIAYIYLFPSSNQSWELKKDQDSIKVYIRNVDDNTKAVSYTHLTLPTNSGV